MGFNKCIVDEAGGVVGGIPEGMPGMGYHTL